jgi:hypothetical protein
VALIEALRMRDGWTGAPLAIAAGSHVVFEHWLGMPLPPGPFAPALTALAGGHVDFAGQQWSESAGLIAGAKIRALAVVNLVRLPGLPDVPIVKEAGFPHLGVVVHRAAQKVGKVLAIKGPDAFWQFQQEELKKYLPLATKVGIRK